jgi:hypothetical protein
MERVNKMTDNKNKLYDLTYTSNNSNIIKSQTIEANSLLDLTKKINNFKELVLITDANILEIKEREIKVKEDEEKTFITDLQCITKLGVSVMAMTPEEALDKINGGYYDIDNSLDLSDLEFNHKAITLEDIDEL